MNWQHNSKNWTLNAMMRRCVYVLLMAMSACATHRTTAPPIIQLKSAGSLPSDESSSEEVKHEVINLVVAAQRAYLERAENRQFSAMLAPGAKIEAGRRRMPGPFDSVFGKERLDNIYEWAAANDVRSVTQFVTVETHVVLDTVDLELLLESTAEKQRAWFGQKFRLIKSNGAWQIVRFRYWPINPDTKLEFSTQFFEEMDQRIEQDLRDGDDRNATYHLMLAYRFDECAALSRRLTDAEPKDTWAWDMRARASALIGDRKDAEMSSRIARDLAGP